MSQSMKQKMALLGAGETQAPQQLSAGRAGSEPIHDAELVEEDDGPEKK